jgi:hypothetical protein
MLDETFAKTKIIHGKTIDRLVASLTASQSVHAATEESGGGQKPPFIPEDDEVSINELSELLLSIPNDGGNDRTEARADWVRICAAVYNVTYGSDEGERLIHVWSSRHPSYSERETRKLWESLELRDFADPDAAIAGLGTLKHEIRMADRTKLADFEAEYDAVWAEEGIVPEQKHGIEFVKVNSQHPLSLKAYLVKHIISAGDFACLVAAPGVGKSLWAPFLAFCVATGREFFGRKVKQGLVWYIATEDQMGMRARLMALSDEYGDLGELFLVENVSDLITKSDSQLAHLIERAERDQPTLIIVDTLAMGFPGLEENSPEAMSRVVNTCRQFTDLGCAVLLVHHDTKDGRQGLPRGHSILNGALDVAIYLKKFQGNIVKGSLSKNRNGSSEQSFAFEIDTKKIGTDTDGDPVFAALCKELFSGATDAIGKNLSKSQRAALDELEALTERSGDWVDEAQWRRNCLNSSAVSSASLKDSRRKAVDRAVRELNEKQQIEIREQKVRVYKQSDPEEPFE